VKDRVPDLSFKSFGAFTAGAAACGTRRRHRTERTATLGWQIWNGRRSRIGDAARHKPRGPDNLQHPVVLAVRRERGLRGAVARRWAALMEIQESKRVPTTRVHVGYTGGISMTTIRGGPERYKRDRQEPCDPWLFVLMDEAENYLVPEPRELGVNDSFAVFKMIATDVVGFEKL